jgi:multiple sugar transport system substrate-binding protein
MKRKFRALLRKFDPFEQAARLFWETFRKKTGRDLDFELVPLDLPQLHDAIMTGDFDVAQVNTDWLAEMHDERVLLDITPMIKENPPDGFPEGWPESLLKLQSFPDGIYGLPFHDGPECFIYRKDLFTSEDEKQCYRALYGRELKVPETWDDFLETAEFFNRPEEGMYGTLFALYPDGHNNIFDFALQVWSRGGNLTGEADHLTLDSPEAEEAMEFYRDLVNRPFVHPQSREFESISSSWAFARGEAAMMTNWFGFATMCETVETSKVHGKVDICALPHATGFSDPISLNVYYTWSISARSKNKSLAYDYARNCVTPESDIALTLAGGVGCRRSTWFDKKINAVIPYYSRMDEIHRYARTLPRSPIWHGIAQIIDALVIEVINTKREVREILAEAQRKVRELEEEAGHKGAKTR